MAIDLEGNIINADGTKTGGKVDLKSGQLLTAPTAAPTTTIAASAASPTNIDVSKIGTAPSFTLPPAPTSTPYDIGTLPSISSLLNPAPTATETQGKALQDQLLTDTKTIGTKGAAQITAEANAGLPDLNKQLVGVNNQITSLQAEALAANNTAEDRLAPTFAIKGEQAQIERARSVKALGLSAIAQTIQGNIALAQDQANKAVEVEFAPVQADIDYLTKALEINKDNLSREDQKRADTLQVQLSDRQRQLDQAKEDKASIISLAAAAIKNNPGNQSVQLAVNQALQSNDLEKALGLIGQYQTDPTATAQAVANLNYTRAQTSKLNADAQAASPGVPTITNPDASKYSTALNIILGSSKFTKDQKASVISAVNTGQDPFTVVKNQAKNIMGQTEATKLTSYEAADNAMQDIQETMAAFYNAGGDTGLLKGTMEQAINRLGSVSDPKLVEISTQVALSLQAYRNAISGTAYSDQEGKDIASVFPGINKSQGLNTAVITGRLKADQSLIDGIYKTALGSTYDDLKAANAPKALPASTDPYASYRAQLQPGEILVLRNGQPYAINRSEFNLKTDKLPPAGMDKI